jgi:protein-disulfide isomerase
VAPLVSKTLGTQSAPITIEVFSDYQCPACRELYLETLRPLIDNYVLTGKVYLIHRDMPLSQHPYSRLAAKYENAAAQVKELEKVSTALFEKQMQWSIDGNVDRVVAEVLMPAEMRQVRQMVESGKMDAAIDSDVERARTFGVRQTPTMVITHNGRSDPVVGVVPYSMLRQYLDELLKK